MPTGLVDRDEAVRPVVHQQPPAIGAPMEHPRRGVLVELLVPVEPLPGPAWILPRQAVMEERIHLLANESVPVAQRAKIRAREGA